MNLFDLIDGITARNEKPRDATPVEVTAYLKWIAARAGITDAGELVMGSKGEIAGMLCGKETQPPRYESVELDGERIRVSRPAQYEDGATCIVMPGRHQPLTTCECLDEAGNVKHTIMLPADRRGGIPMTAAKVRDAVGLRAARGRKRPTAAMPTEISPVERVQPEAASTPQPVAATVSSAPQIAPSAAIQPEMITALLDRVAALEARIAQMPQSPAAPANDNEATAMEWKRHPARLRMIRRYLAMRAERQALRSALTANVAAWRGERVKRRRSASGRLMRRDQARQALADLRAAQSEARAAMAGMTALSDKAAALQVRVDQLERWEGDDDNFGRPLSWAARRALVS